MELNSNKNNCKHCYISDVCNEYDKLKRLYLNYHSGYLNTDQKETLLKILAKCCLNYKE